MLAQVKQIVKQNGKDLVLVETETGDITYADTHKLKTACKEDIHLIGYIQPNKHDDAFVVEKIFQIENSKEAEHRHFTDDELLDVLHTWDEINSSNHFDELMNDIQILLKNQKSTTVLHSYKKGDDVWHREHGKVSIIAAYTNYPGIYAVNVRKDDMVIFASADCLSESLTSPKGTLITDKGEY